MGKLNTVDARFFKRNCFAITSNDLLEFMKEQKDDNSLLLLQEEDTNKIYLYSNKKIITYDENDIINCVSKELKIEISNIIIDGDIMYSAVVYFVERERKVINEKEYYVIQNTEKKFFKIDNNSGGYPCFIDDFEFCEKYKSEHLAFDFLNSDYATKLFKKEFEGCIIIKVVNVVY